MKTIYEQHAASFKRVSAYVILQNGERVATCAFNVGMAVTCYFHIIGIQMQRGTAGGGGYDRHSAAMINALHKAKITEAASAETSKIFHQINHAIAKASGGEHWDRVLEMAGFKVLQAV